MFYMLTIIAANIDNKKKNIANHFSSVNLLSDVNRFAIKSMPDSKNISGSATRGAKLSANAGFASIVNSIKMPKIFLTFLSQG